MAGDSRKSLPVEVRVVSRTGPSAPTGLAQDGDSVALAANRRAGIHWTMVSQYRKKAVRDRLLEPVDEYIPHRRASLYRVHEKRARITRKKFALFLFARGTCSLLPRAYAASQSY